MENRLKLICINDRFLVEAVSINRRAVSKIPNNGTNLDTQIDCIASGVYTVLVEVDAFGRDRRHFLDVIIQLRQHSVDVLGQGPRLAFQIEKSPWVDGWQSHS